MAFFSNMTSFSQEIYRFETSMGQNPSILLYSRDRNPPSWALRCTCREGFLPRYFTPTVDHLRDGVLLVVFGNQKPFDARDGGVDAQ